MPNLSTRAVLEQPKKAAELYVVLDGRDYRMTLETLLKLVTPANIGLDNVENVKDIDKPISTLVQQALDRKANRSDIEGLISVTELANEIKELRDELMAKIAAGTGGSATPPGSTPPAAADSITIEKVTQTIEQYFAKQELAGGVFKILREKDAELASAVATASEKATAANTVAEQAKTDLTALTAKVSGIETALSNPSNPDQGAAVTANTAAIAALGSRVAAAEQKVADAEAKVQLAATAQSVTDVANRVQVLETKEPEVTLVKHTTLETRVTDIEGQLGDFETTESVETLIADYMKTTDVKAHVAEEIAKIPTGGSGVTPAQLQEAKDATTAVDAKVGVVEGKVAAVEPKVQTLETKVGDLETKASPTGVEFAATKQKADDAAAAVAVEKGRIDVLDPKVTANETKATQALEKATEAKQTADAQATDIQDLKAFKQAYDTEKTTFAKSPTVAADISAAKTDCEQYADGKVQALKVELQASIGLKADQNVVDGMSGQITALENADQTLTSNLEAEKLRINALEAHDIGQLKTDFQQLQALVNAIKAHVSYTG